MPARRPTIRRLVLCLSLGAATTTLIAWGSAVLAPEPLSSASQCIGWRSRNFAAGEGLGYIELWRADSAWTTQHWAWALPVIVTNSADLPHTVCPDSQFLFDAPVSNWVRDRVLPWESSAAPWPGEGAREFRLVSAYGGPWRCLWYELTRQGTMGGPAGAPLPAMTYRLHGAIAVPPPLDLRSPRRAAAWPIGLPICPYWPGLLANLALWSLVWIAVLATIPMLTRRLVARQRTRRNRCPHCNYDLRATAPNLPCPECGQPRQAQEAAS